MARAILRLAARADGHTSVPEATGTFAGNMCSNAVPGVPRQAGPQVVTLASVPGEVGVAH
jgi:hypothetical protein